MAVKKGTRNWHCRNVVRVENCGLANAGKAQGKRAEGAEAASLLLCEYAHAMASHIMFHCPAYPTMVGSTLSNKETKHTLTCTQVDTVVRNVTNTEKRRWEWALWYDLTVWFTGIWSWLSRGIQERKQQNRVLKKPENTLKWSLIGHSGRSSKNKNSDRNVESGSPVHDRQGQGVYWELG